VSDAIILRKFENNGTRLSFLIEDNKTILNKKLKTKLWDQVMKTGKNRIQQV
jgi:hypothetical protein